MSKEVKPDSSGCIMAVIAIVIFFVVGTFVTDEAGLFIGMWAGFFAALITYIALGKLLSD